MKEHLRKSGKTKTAHGRSKKRLAQRSGLIAALTFAALLALGLPNSAFSSSLNEPGSIINAILKYVFDENADSLASSSINFDSPLFTPGSPHGQFGWSSSNPAYDHKIIDNTSYVPAPPVAFGARSLRMSNAVTSGSFDDQTFTSSLADEAGETSAQNGGMSGGTRQNRFAAQWEFTSADPSGEQVGLNVVASPDRGDGARMSWIQMVDAPSGLQVNFFDFQRYSPGNCADDLDFIHTNIASGLARNQVHAVRVEMEFYDGPANDVVRVFVNGVLRHVGTSWEDYFRDCEGNPTRTVDSILFRTGGTAAPGTAGKGFFIDNIALNDNIGSSTTTVVTDANPQGWGFTQENTPGGSGGFVTGPAPAPLGTGSARLTIGNGNGLILGKFGYNGVLLSQITQLSYNSFQVSANAVATPNLQFVYDYDVTDAITGFQGRLIFEPYQSNLPVQQSTWQQWSPLLGKWWASGNATSTLDDMCPQSSPCTWNQILAAFPNAGIHPNPAFGAVLFKAGSGTFALNSNVDNFTIGINGANETFDFEPASLIVDDDGFASSGNCGDTVSAAHTTVASAVAAAAPGQTITICPGTYPTASTIVVNKAGLTLKNAEATKPVLQIAQAQGFIFQVTAPGVMLDGLEIQKTDVLAGTHNLIQVLANNFTGQNNLIYGPDPGVPWGSTSMFSRAFEVGGGLTGLNINNNVIRYLRQPGYLNASSGSITNNNVSRTRGWVVDGATATYNFTGNTWGEPQNEACDIALLASVNPANYPTRLAMSIANDNAFICAQYAGGENGRATAYVDSTPTLGNGSDNDNYTTIQEGINGALAGGTVDVAAGGYNEDITINKQLLVTGAGAATTIITGPIGGSGGTVNVAASNVELRGFTITRAGNNVSDWNNPGLNSAGLSVNGTAITGMNIHDNRFVGNRTAIDINNSSGHTVRNNVIEDNRTGVIFRNQTDNITFVENSVINNWTVGVLFLDASGGTNSPIQTALNSTFSNNSISGNWYGEIVDRQAGGSIPAPGTTNLKNFRNNWFGTNAPAVSTSDSAEPGYAAQIPAAYGGTATDPGGQPDILGPASANFDYSPFLSGGADTNIETTVGRGTYGFQGSFSALHVTAASVQIAAGNPSNIQEGIDVITAGGNLTILNGTYPGNVNVNKLLNLKGTPTIGGTLTTSAAGSSISPGNSPGIINSGDLTLAASSTLNIEINGPAVGTGYDQMNVTGTVNLGGAALNLSAGYTPAPGAQFVIVNNDGSDPVSGTFNALSEGEVVFIGSVPFSISYVGGTGNDVVLTATANCNTVIGASVNTPTGVPIQVPFSVDTVTGNGLLSFDTTVTYNSTVITNPVVNGTTMTAGGDFTVSNPSPGTLVISYFRAQPLSGSGDLFTITFDAVGGVGTTSGVNFSSFMFNEGTPCVSTSNGSVTIMSGNITGVVSYGNPRLPTNAFRPVPNTTLSAVGSINVSTNSAFGTGAYTLSGLGAGPYTVTPTKTGDVNGISSFDSAAIALHVVGTTPLVGGQIVAADVSNNGTITSFDAALIARFVTSLPNSGITGTWKFVPASLTYPDVNTNQTGDYTGYLMGDVTGNWIAPTSFGFFEVPQLWKAPVAPESAIPVAIPEYNRGPGSSFPIPVSVGDTTGQGILSMDFTITYDPSVILLDANPVTLTGTVGNGMTLTYNDSTPGTLIVSLFSAQPRTGSGTLLNFNFTAVGDPGDFSPITWSSFMFNEGIPQHKASNGLVRLLAPTAANASVQGQVMDIAGNPVGMARVFLTNAAGRRWTAISNAFGHFSVENVPVGTTYLVSVSSRRHTFEDFALTVSDDIAGMTIIANK